MTSGVLNQGQTAAPLGALRTATKIGLIGGAVAISIALQGMIQTFSARDIISGLLPMSETLMLITFFVLAYLAASRVGSAQPFFTLLAGTLAGFVSSLLLVVLVWAGSSINLSNIFINATSQLYDLLTFKQGLVSGSLMQIAFGTVTGLVAALLYLLAPLVRRAIITSLGLLIALAFFQDWVLRTVSNTPPAVEVVLDDISRLLYVGNGMSPSGALLLFLLAAVIYYLWNDKRAAYQSAIGRLPPTTRRAGRVMGVILLVALLLLLPVLLGIENSEILDNVGMYLLMGLGLNIVVGFAGLLDLGYVAFFAIGAYTVGVLTSAELGHAPYLTSWWLALPFGVIIAVAAGVLLGIPVLKMRGDYLAIVTLGFGEIIRLVAGSDMLKDIIGGAQGTRSIAKPDIGPFKFGFQEFTLPVLGQIQFQTQQEFYYLFLAGCLLALFVATRVKSSRLGRAWMALREDEDVAQAMGIDLVATKLLAFAMGAFFGGLSGAMQASKLGSIFPNSFGFIISINVLAVIIVGGMGSIPGVVVGAIALTALPELTREFSDYRFLFYGAALVAMMLIRPEGLVPEARRKMELEESRGEAEAVGEEPVVMDTVGQP